MRIHWVLGYALILEKPNQSHIFKVGTGSWSGSTHGDWTGFLDDLNCIEMWHLAARYLILRRNIQALRGGFQLDSVEPGWRG